MDRKEQFKEVLSEDFSARHHISEMDAGMHTYHYHDVLEILLIVRGPSKCIVNNEEVVIDPQTVLVFNNMDLHGVFFDRKCIYERYVLFFKPSFVESLSTNEAFLLECFFLRFSEIPQKIVLSVEAYAELRHLLDRLIQCQKDDYGYELQKKLYVGLILLLINREYRRVHQMGNIDLPYDYPSLLKTLNYIYGHLNEDFSLNDICRIAGMSRNAFCRLFKHVFGFTPMEYVKNCRLMRARNLLSEGYSVDNVCALAGFRNLSHFSRSFKDFYSISPKKFQIGERNAKGGHSRTADCLNGEAAQK